MFQEVKNIGHSMASKLINCSARFSNRKNQKNAKILGAAGAMMIGSALLITGVMGVIFTPIFGVVLLVAGKMTVAGSMARATLTGAYGALALVGKGAIEKGEESTGLISTSKKLSQMIAKELHNELSNIFSPNAQRQEAEQRFDSSKTAKKDFTATVNCPANQLQQKPISQLSAPASPKSRK